MREGGQKEEREGKGGEGKGKERGGRERLGKVYCFFWAYGLFNSTSS